MYQGQPESSLNNRHMYVPRGKGLGGSGSINAMIYVRGAKQDFDDWASAGNPQWSHDQVLPYFKAMETFHAGYQQAHWHDSYYRGDQGKLHITSMHDKAHPICSHFINAAQSLGLPQNHGFNGASIAGVGIYEANIYKGQRHSSYQSHLKPALKRSNLALWIHAQVQKLIIQDKQVQGVEVVYKGQVRHIYSQKDTILCAGAVANPQLLQLSGVGAASLLDQYGIDCQHNLPAVGENLQDHYCASFYYRCQQKTLNDDFGSITGKLKAAWQYVTKRQGPLSISVNQAGGFLNGDENNDQAEPNIQLYFNPLSYDIPKCPNARLQPLPYSGFLLAANACRPTSRGSIRIQSAKPQQAPAITFNFLSTQKDQCEAIQAGNLIRKIMQAPSLQHITQSEEKPAAAVSNAAQMLNYFQQHGHSIYHLCGTCVMGDNAQQHVVNEQLQVHGLANLRIADASVFPNITAGNINAPTMMLANKAVDLLMDTQI